MAKVLCVLYDDPTTTGYPPKYARNEIPKIEVYPGGQTTPSPKHIDLTPGELLGGPTDTKRVLDRCWGRTRGNWCKVVRTQEVSIEDGRLG
jgi:hypothetical protein